jgi:hypothetical protein
MSWRLINLVRPTCLRRYSAFRSAVCSVNKERLCEERRASGKEVNLDCFLNVSVLCLMKALALSRRNLSATIGQRHGSYSDRVHEEREWGQDTHTDLAVTGWGLSISSP